MSYDILSQRKYADSDKENILLVIKTILNNFDWLLYWHNTND